MNPSGHDVMFTNEMTDRLQQLRDLRDSLPRRRECPDPEFRAKFAEAKSLGPDRTMDEFFELVTAGLRWVKCRRCGGSGVYHRVTGPDACLGHARMGYCKNGKSLGPRERAVAKCRESAIRLADRRAQWKRLAALEPKNRWDCGSLIREMEITLRYGNSYRATVEELRAAAA